MKARICNCKHKSSGRHTKMLHQIKPAQNSDLPKAISPTKSCCWPGCSELSQPQRVPQHNGNQTHTQVHPDVQTPAQVGSALSATEQAICLPASIGCQASPANASKTRPQSLMNEMPPLVLQSPVNYRGRQVGNT